jgi:hypothetical protein
METAHVTHILGEANARRKEIRRKDHIMPKTQVTSSRLRQNAIVVIAG